MQKSWVKVGEKVGGPFTLKKLQQLAKKGKLKPTHLVSSDKKRWRRADKISGLSFLLENASPGIESASKSEEKTDDTSSTNSPVPASQSKRVSPPFSVKYRPVEDEKIPTVTKKKKSYLQVLTRGGEVKKYRLRVVRRQLLRGKLTRHNPTRWIEPRPRKSDYKFESEPDAEIQKVMYLNDWQSRVESGESDNEIQKGMYLDDVKKWKTRREWRPIGEGLVKESYRIGLLYRPAKVFAELGTTITGCLLFVVVLIMFAVMMFQSEGFKQVAEGMDPGIGFAYVLNVQLMRLSLPALLAAGVGILASVGVIAALGGFLFGGLGGWLLGTCISPLLPKPPPDGYVEQEEQKT